MGMACGASSFFLVFSNSKDLKLRINEAGLKRLTIIAKSDIKTINTGVSGYLQPAKLRIKCNKL
jgi:hypothetical protein